MHKFKISFPKLIIALTIILLALLSAFFIMKNKPQAYLEKNKITGEQLAVLQADFVRTLKQPDGTYLSFIDCEKNTATESSARNYVFAMLSYLSLYEATGDGKYLEWFNDDFPGLKAAAEGDIETLHGAIPEVNRILFIMENAGIDKKSPETFSYFLTLSKESTKFGQIYLVNYKGDKLYEDILSPENNFSVEDLEFPNHEIIKKNFGSLPHFYSRLALGSYMSLSNEEQKTEARMKSAMDFLKIADAEQRMIRKDYEIKQSDYIAGQCSELLAGIYASDLIENNYTQKSKIFFDTENIYYGFLLNEIANPIETFACVESLLKLEEKGVYTEKPFELMSQLVLKHIAQDTCNNRILSYKNENGINFDIHVAGYASYILTREKLKTREFSLEK